MTNEAQPTKRRFTNNLNGGLAAVIAGALALSAFGWGVKTCAYYNLSRKIEYTEVVRTGTQTVAYDTGATDYLATSLDYDEVPAVYVLDSSGNEICIYGKSLEDIEKGTKLKSISYSPVVNCDCNDLEGIELVVENEQH